METVFWIFLLLTFASLESAKILTICLIGGSHYMLLDEISHNFHQRGHEVRMLLQLGNPLITGFSYAERPHSYKRSTWTLGDAYVKEYNGWFLQEQSQFLLGRENLSGFLKFMGHLSYQCDKLLEDKQMINFLQKENYDIIILDAFNPCSFILARRLGVQYVAFYPGSLNGPLAVALPSPLSYVHVSDINLWDRTKNLFYSLFSPFCQKLVWSVFQEVAERHLVSPPGGLCELHQAAELWAFNTDFSLEFPQPLLPYTVLVGGLLNKPAQPLDQDLDLWIAGFAEFGFIVVTLGSMISSVSVDPLLVELVAGFSLIPQGVMWRYDPHRWPAHLDPPPNVRLMSWLPVNDLLGHKHIRLFVTHGGQNSLLQAVYHAVLVLGIPLFGDQFDNMIRAERKGLGLILKPTDVTRETLSSSIQILLQNNRSRSAARSLSRIHTSHPVSPLLRLTQWVEHVLSSGGGAHLKPASLAQPWYQKYLLDSVLLLGLLGLLVLYWVLCTKRNQKNLHSKVE